jgi:hypothetical protein
MRETMRGDRRLLRWPVGVEAVLDRFDAIVALERAGGEAAPAFLLLCFDDVWLVSAVGGPVPCAVGRRSPSGPTRSASTSPLRIYPPPPTRESAREEHWLQVLHFREWGVGRRVGQRARGEGVELTIYKGYAPR